METMADKIHAEQYQKTMQIVLNMAKVDQGGAQNLIQDMIAGLSSPAVRPEDIQTLFFIEALRKRLEKHVEEVGNLYLISDDDGQQIKIFNFMAEKFPVVRFAQDLINSACIAAVEGAETVTIMDIGIGTGQQIVRLLAQAFQNSSALKQVNIIGIEPAVTSLEIARTAFVELAKKYSVELTFEDIPKSIEALTEQDWRNIEILINNAKGKLIINASFALHHIRPVALRSELFVRLKGFSPEILTLIEPYADFLTTNLLERFNNAWHHYGLVFGAIDQIEATTEEKNRVKALFFAREIQDVLSEEHQRVEQFEMGEMWLSRLENAGFKPTPIESTESSIPNCPFVTIHHLQDYMSLNVEGYPILSIIAAR